MTLTGIVGYGTALPNRYEANPAIGKSLGILTRTIPSEDEDAITLATAAGNQILQHFSMEKRKEIGAIYIGSESHPYAVKSSAGLVAHNLNLSRWIAAADFQFACRAGSQAMLAGYGLVKSNQVKLAMAGGSDTAQAAKNDVLRYTAAAGAGLVLLGKGSAVLAEIIDVVSYTTDTPDFWRRPGEEHPQHGGRFSADPGYLHHVLTASQELLHRNNIKSSNVNWAGFHTPNGKLPLIVAQELGFTRSQLENSLPATYIGNTYAAAIFMVLTSILDKADPDQLILLTSYGSGAGADSWLLRTTSALLGWRKNSAFKPLSINRII